MSFDLMAEASKMESEAASQGPADVSTSEVQSTEGQSVEQTPPQEVESDPASAEKVLNELLNEKPDKEAEKAILDMVHGLGAIHKGQPVTIESPAQLKELIQKGFDYTKKTMEHAESVKAKEAEFQKLESEFKEKEEFYSKREQELESTISDNRVMESILLKIQANDPELFQHFQSLWRSEISEYEKQKPLIAKFEKEVGSVKEQLNNLIGQNKQGELAKIKEGWESELSSTQEKFAGSFAKLGVKPNWDKVKDAWASDSSGKMSVEQALYAVHGKEIIQANESYKKMLLTKDKVNASILGKSGISQGQKGQSETIKVKPGDYESILKLASAQN